MKQNSEESDRKVGRDEAPRGYVSTGNLVAATAIPVIAMPTIVAIHVLAHTSLSRDVLIQDVRRLSDFVEAVHRDPYIRGGGKIAYHRRLHETIGAIPVG